MSSQRFAPRVTLTQVVILAIVLVFALGLALPATLQFCSAASRLRCVNNLNQLGLASHNYEQHFNRFPPGTVVESAKVPEDRLSFLTSLLPYLAQDTLYKRFDLKQGWESAANQAALSPVPEVYRCPAESRSGTEFAKMAHYVGIAGSGEGAATLPLKSARAGVFGYDRTTRLKDIKDGNSNPLLLLETGRENGPWTAGGPATVRGVDPDEETPIAKDGPFGMAHQFGGFRATANAAMADGSVRMLLPAKVSGAVLAALATIDGGEAPPGDW
jgi:hypothetical protein